MASGKPKKTKRVATLTFSVLLLVESTLEMTGCLHPRGTDALGIQSLRTLYPARADSDRQSEIVMQGEGETDVLFGTKIYLPMSFLNIQSSGHASHNTDEAVYNFTKTPVCCTLFKL